MAEDRCISCGEVIPEGRQVCLKCESATEQKRIFGRECISCNRFFDCNGKEYEGQLCVMYEERKSEDGKQEDVFKKGSRYSQIFKDA